MDTGTVMAWVERYEQAWRDDDVAGVGDLFIEDAQRPRAAPGSGRADLAGERRAVRSGPELDLTGLDGAGRLSLQPRDVDADAEGTYRVSPARNTRTAHTTPS